MTAASLRPAAVMSSGETGHMSAVETGQMTAAETSVLSNQKDILPGSILSPAAPRGQFRVWGGREREGDPGTRGDLGCLGEDNRRGYQDIISHA